MTGSADSNIGPGEERTDTIPGTQWNTAPDNHYGSQRMELDNSPGDGGYGMEQSEMSRQPQSANLRRSTRAGRGKTSRFSDYAM